MCKFCAAKVIRKLKILPGVKDVTVDLKGGRAEITMKDGEQPKAATVREAIEAAGFKPGVIKVPEETLR